MVTFRDVIIYLENVGVADVLLPFILVFTVIFAILQKIKLFGDESKRFNVVIALIIGLAVVIPHVLRPSENDVVNIMNKAFPSVSLFIIAILAVFLLIGLWGAKPKFTKGAGGWLSLIAIIIVAAIFTYAAGWWGRGYLPNWLYWLDDPGTITLIVIILVFVIVVGYITGGEKGEGEGSWKKFREGLGELFGGGE